MIPVRSQGGRYNLPIYLDTYFYIYSSHNYHIPCPKTNGGSENNYVDYGPGPRVGRVIIASEKASETLMKAP